MATTLSIQVGALSASRTFANDIKARTVLLNYYTDHGLGPDNASNQEKIVAVLDEIIRHLQNTSRAYAINQAREAARAQATADNAFE